MWILPREQLPSNILKSRISLACPGCGARLGRNHSFCPKCGMKIEGAIARELEHRRVRTIPLDKETLKMLENFIKEGGPVKRGDKNLLFPFNRHRGWQIICECAQRAGLPKLVNPETGKVHGVSPHKLRDAFAIHAVKKNDSGDGLRMLQEHLGHQNISTTMGYRKVAGEELKDWYEQALGESLMVMKPLRPKRGGFLRSVSLGPIHQGLSFRQGTV